MLWYLSDPGWPPPNLTLLNNALQQTGWTGEVLDEETWRSVLRQRLQAIEWERVQEDVRPFLDLTARPDLLTGENLMRLVT